LGDLCNKLEKVKLANINPVLKVVGQKLSVETKAHASKKRDERSATSLSCTSYEETYREDCGPLLKELLERIVYTDGKW